MTDPIATYGHIFVTTDVDQHGNAVRFEMIEDEGGDMFWGFGHVPKELFIQEVNRWLMHVGADPLHGKEIRETGVDYRWAQVDDESNEHFSIVEPKTVPSGSEIFPVTRLVL